MADTASVAFDATDLIANLFSDVEDILALIAKPAETSVPDPSPSQSVPTSTAS